MQPAPPTLTLLLANLAATETFGRQLGSLLFPGAIVALVGPLGAGKTHLARAIAEGLGVPDSRVVTSPTFVLIQEYTGRLPIFHFDAYRLTSDAEFDDLGTQEYYDGGGVCLIEWADRVPGSLPPEYLRITLEPTGPTSRRASLAAIGSRYEHILQQLPESSIF
jgi:tRNA threonylcarbamoyladenosine biosynthesis protein TsaE